MSKKINIAVDGHSSTGKSTLAKQLAARLNYLYIDTGAMYRAVTLYALNAGIAKDGSVDEKLLVKTLDKIKIDFANQGGTNRTLLNGVDVEGEIRSMAISDYVSLVARIPEVRAKLRAMQQQVAKRGGVVMDGRDIGSAVLPDAALKIFMTADPKIRAKRRYEELRAKGDSVSLKQVQMNIKERDHIDTSRKEDPLVRVPEAYLLDNTALTQHQQLNLALEWAQKTIQHANQV